MAKNKCVSCHMILEAEYYLCSITCACLAGYYSVRKGWLKDPKELEDKKVRDELISRGPFRERPINKDYL